jgi:hypothetical protein
MQLRKPGIAADYCFSASRKRTFKKWQYIKVAWIKKHLSMLEKTSVGNQNFKLP